MPQYAVWCHWGATEVPLGAARCLFGGYGAIWQNGTPLNGASSNTLAGTLQANPMDPMRSAVATLFSHYPAPIAAAMQFFSCRELIFGCVGRQGGIWGVFPHTWYVLYWCISQQLFKCVFTVPCTLSREGGCLSNSCGGSKSEVNGGQIGRASGVIGQAATKILNMAVDLLEVVLLECSTL